MSGVPASSRSFNGGTVTNPIVIDLTADLADRTALDVIQPSTFGFGVRPWRFRQTDFAYLQMETTGIVSTAGNDLSTAGGGLTVRGNTATVTKADGTPQHVLGPTPQAGFFGVNPVAQPTGVAVTAAALHAALVTLGLITA